MKDKPKWRRSLGTSKRAQGVTTPPAPQHPQRRKRYFKEQYRKYTPWYRKLWHRVIKWWEAEG